MPLYKRLDGLNLKLDSESPGAFRATFATFNVIDLDGDVTIPGAFTTGEQVRIAQWGHNWGALPVGRGTIGQDAERAWVDGQFLMETQAGRDTYETVKLLGDLQEWSYGFDILKRSEGEFGEPPEYVQYLEKMRVIEVSPVMLGAGIDTGTDAIKSLSRHFDSLADQSETVLAAVADLRNRLQSLADLRAKDGRVLSERNRERIRTHAGAAGDIAADLLALYEQTAPEPKSAGQADVQQAYLAALRLELESLPLIYRAA